MKLEEEINRSENILWEKWTVLGLINEEMSKKENQLSSMEESL